MCFFSVLIPAYNVEKYIEECLDSVINQSFSKENVEIIVANDGSTDATLNICKKYEELYPNIRVYDKINEGLVVTRRFLIDKAKGRYLLFLDADDKWEKNLLTDVYEGISTYEYPDIISFGFNMWENNKIKPYYTTDKETICINLKTDFSGWKRIFGTDTYNSIWGKAIKRDILKKSELPDSLKSIKRGEDKLLTISCLERSDNWLILKENLYDYRIDNVSMTRSFNAQYFDEILLVDKIVYKKIQEYFRDTGDFIEWANNTLSKYYDYIIELNKSNLQLNEKKKYREYYRKNDIIERAISISLKSNQFRCKVKAFLIKYKMYRIISLYYR